MADDRSVLIELRGDAQSYVAAVREATEAAKKFASTLNQMSDSQTKTADSATKAEKSMATFSARAVASGIIVANMAMAAVRWGKNMLNSFAETGVETRKLQMVLGGTAEQMSGLIALTGAYKIPFDALLVSYRTFAMQATTNTKAFRDLGLSLKDGSGNIKDSITLLGEAADKFRNMANETERTAKFGELFGRRFKELTPILALGSEGMKKVMDNAKKLGIVLDENGVKKAIAFTQTQNQLHQSMQGLSFTIMQNVVPTLTNLLHGMTEIIVVFNNFLRSHSFVVKAFLAVAASIGVVVAGMKAYAFVEGVIEGLATAKARWAATVATSNAVAATSYEGVAVAAEAAAEAEASAQAFSVIGIASAIATAGLVAGLIWKMRSAMKGLKLDLPSFQPPGGGTEQLIPTGTTAAGSKVNKALEDAKKNLANVTKIWDARVEAAKTALDAAKKKAQEYDGIVSKLSDVMKAPADVTNMFKDSFAKYLGPSALLATFRRKIDESKEFVADIKKLMQMQVDPTTLMQLAAAGPEGGLDAARMMINNPSMLTDLKNMQSELASYANDLATSVGAYVAPESAKASAAVPGLAYQLAGLEYARGINIGKAQSAVSNVNNVTVNASTNADSHQIASDTAWMLRGTIAAPFRSGIGRGATNYAERSWDPSLTTQSWAQDAAHTRTSAPSSVPNASAPSYGTVVNGYYTDIGLGGKS